MKGLSIFCILCTLGLVACQQSGPGSVLRAPGGGTGSLPPPPVESDSGSPTGTGSPIVLMADAQAISADQEVTLRLRNLGEESAQYGRPVVVERWNGSLWVETEASSQMMWTMELRALGPGETGEAQRWPFFPKAPPEPGWYRFTKIVHLGNRADATVTRMVRARVEVTNDVGSRN